MSIHSRSRIPVGPAGSSSTSSSSTVAGTAPSGATPPGATPARSDRMDPTRSSGGVATPSGTGAPRGASHVALRGMAPLADGVELDGSGALVVEGRSSSVRDMSAAAEVLYDAAKALGAADKPALASIPSAQKKALSHHLLPFLMLDVSSAKRQSSSALKARSASFAMLSQMAASSSRKSDAPLQTQLAQSLIAAAQMEKHPGLRRHMLLGLDAIPKKLLGRAEAVARDALVAELAPGKPPYDAWFGKSEKPVFRVRQYVMDEFYKSELTNYRQMGFDVKVVNAEHAVATKILKDPEGKHPPVTATVELVNRDTRVLDAMDDRSVHAVFYSGHSELGGVGKISAEHAPAQKGDKLVAMFACRTKQNLQALRSRFPQAHLLVSENGTYGHDDRLVIRALMAGVAARADYSQMERALEKAEVWESNNYIFPHDRTQWRHVDLDKDGTTDVTGARRDLLFNVDVRSNRGKRITFQPAHRVPEPGTLDSSRLLSAVSWFNTEFHYFTEDFGNRAEHARDDRFAAAGWFTSSDRNEVVRVTQGTESPPVWRVQVNAAYANLDPDALAMMVTYELAQNVQAQTRPDESEHTRRMRSLAMTGAYTYYHVEFSDVADELLGRFAERYAFPQTLTWPVVEAAVSADAHAEVSSKVTKRLEQGMQLPFLEVNPARSSTEFRAEVHKALEVLRRSPEPIAQAVFRDVVSGRIKVDTLSDLTRPDFMRVRRDLLKDGVDIKLDAFMDMHDEKSKVMRAITANLDGYMWDDRVYIALGRKPADLAATLVHEASHVWNHSEEKYRSQKNVFVEEYRSFYAEELFRKGTPNAARCKAIKEELIANYGLTSVTPADVPDVPPGILVRD